MALTHGGSTTFRVTASQCTRIAKITRVHYFRKSARFSRTPAEAVCARAMPKSPIYLGVFFITALCTGALATVSDTIAKIDQFISAEMSRQAIPGMALAAVKNGEIVVAKGYGFANLDPRVPATRHSTSKPDRSASNSPRRQSCCSKSMGSCGLTTG